MEKSGWNSIVNLRTQEHGVQLIEVATGKRIGRPLFPAGRGGAEWTFACWSFSPDGKYVATGAGLYRRDPDAAVTNVGAVEVWDAATGNQVAADNEHELGSVVSVGFAPNGREVWFESEPFRDDDGGK